MLNHLTKFYKLQVSVTKLRQSVELNTFYLKNLRKIEKKQPLYNILVFNLFFIFKPV